VSLDVAFTRKYHNDGLSASLRVDLAAQLRSASSFLLARLLSSPLQKNIFESVNIQQKRYLVKGQSGIEHERVSLVQGRAREGNLKLKGNQNKQTKGRVTILTFLRPLRCIRRGRYLVASTWRNPVSAPPSKIRIPPRYRCQQLCSFFYQTNRSRQSRTRRVQILCFRSRGVAQERRPKRCPTQPFCKRQFRLHLGSCCNKSVKTIDRSKNKEQIITKREFLRSSQPKVDIILHLGRVLLILVGVQDDVGVSTNNNRLFRIGKKRLTCKIVHIDPEARQPL